MSELEPDDMDKDVEWAVSDQACCALPGKG